MVGEISVQDHRDEVTQGPLGEGLFYVPYSCAPSASGSHSPGFARPEWVELAASLLESASPVSDPNPGGVFARYRIAIGPGKVRVGCTVTGDERDSTHSPRGRVSEWSRKSRLRMVETMCSLDWGPVVDPGPGWRPVMLTLTLPGDWLAVAPTGKAFKRLFKRFRDRWARKWGAPSWVWKLEFQRRGAPHLHIYTAVPVCAEFYSQVDGVGATGWLADTWYEAVGSGDERHRRAGVGVDWGEGIRASDPKRLGVYFLKRATGHNVGHDKEYQHRVPFAWGGIDYETGERGPEDAGPGRFWGYEGLQKCEVQVELDDEQFWQWRRLLRRWARANGRELRSLFAGRRQGGMVLANDAAGLVAQAARWAMLSRGGDVRCRGSGDGDSASGFAADTATTGTAGTTVTGATARL